MAMACLTIRITAQVLLMPINWTLILMVLAVLVIGFNERYFKTII